MSVDALTYLLCALAILMVPLNWLAAFLLAAGIHELGHICAVYSLGGKINNIKISISGAIIETGLMPVWKNLLSSAAGPAASLLLVLFISRFPRVAVCGLCHGFYNLLPVYPLDGGRILNEIYKLLHIQSREIVSKCNGLILYITIVVLVFLTIWFRFRGLLFALPLLLKEKYLAKKREKGYNKATIEMR